jgi:glycosyltransferase involved in cell wall biosynthesis
MRILQVANGFPPVDRGGVETYTMNLSRALAARGHDVRIFCRYADVNRLEFSLRDDETCGLPVRRVVNNFTSVASFEGYYKFPRIERIFAQTLHEWRPDVVHFQHAHGLSMTLLERATREGVPWTLTIWDYWFNCPTVNALLPDLRSCPGSHRNPECLSCLTGGVTPGTVSGAAIKHRHPFGISERTLQFLRRLLPPLARVGLLWLYDHTLNRQSLAGWKWRPPSTGDGMLDTSPILARNRYALQMLEGGSCLIAPSPHVKEFFADFGVAADHVKVIEPGLDLSLWQGLTPMSRPLGARLQLGYIGSLLPYKGADLVIRAVRQQDHADVDLWLHGFETHGTPYSRLIHELAGDDPRIHFTGAYQARQLPSLLGRLDVMLLPTVANETFSFVTREAVLAGVPVVASARGGIVNAIRDDVNGRLLPPGDMAAWTEALQQLMAEPERITRMSAAQRGEKVKSIEENAAEMEALYERMLAKRALA